MAVKFFLAPGAFERELGYYQNAKLRDILVPVVHYDDNESGTARSSQGYVYPPFIIVERGEVRLRTNAWADGDDNLRIVCPVSWCAARSARTCAVSQRALKDQCLHWAACRA